MKQTSRFILSGLVILTLVLLPVLQTLPSNLMQSQTASAQGGITLSNVQSTSGSVILPVQQITISSFNVGTGSNRTLVVGVEANSGDATSITFNGTSLTKKVSSFTNNDAEFWYLTNPSGTGNIVVTMSGSTSVVVGAYAFSGVDQTNPIPTSNATHNTSSSSPAISITTQYSSSVVLDSSAIFGGVTLGSPTCTNEWNHNVQNTITGKITGASSSTTVSSPSKVTCSWTASPNGDLWDDVTIEVKAAAPPTAPQSPTGLTATQVSSQINLSWNAPTNNGGSAITGYKIERSTDGGSTWSTIVSNTGSTSTRYSDTGLAAGTTFTYRVSAINSVGTSSPSNTESATTFPSSYWTAKTGLLIPLYTDPLSDGLHNGWGNAISIKNNHTDVPMYVIVNVNNGPKENPGDTSGQSDFITGIQNLRAAGINVLGYVWTGYGSPHNSAKCCPYNIPQGNITQWHSFYPKVNGIFFDGMAYENTTAVTYYQNLTSYAKSLGMNYTIGNPGSPTSSSYLGSVDILNTFEQSNAPTTTDLQAATMSGVDKHNFSFLAYNVTNSTFTSQPIGTDSGYVGTMYFTDDGGPNDGADGFNPWDQISTYLSTLATDLDQ